MAAGQASVATERGAIRPGAFIDGCRPAHRLLRSQEIRLASKRLGGDINFGLPRNGISTMAQKYSPLQINRELATNLHDIHTRSIRDEEARQKLGKLLQNALKLEFATIPTYLSAAFSLKRSRTRKSGNWIMRAAIEEMLHMTVVANLMNAIGIAPDIVKAVPQYPMI
jgi:hypothetical protein